MLRVWVERALEQDRCVPPKEGLCNLEARDRQDRKRKKKHESSERERCRARDVDLFAVILSIHLRVVAAFSEVYRYSR